MKRLFIFSIVLFSSSCEVPIACEEGYVLENNLCVKSEPVGNGPEPVPVDGTVHFSSSFEEEDFFEPSPSFKFLKADRPMDNGMMYGPEDIYYISRDKAYRGNKSLRLNFGGRNNFCNTCGTKTIELSQSEADSGCVELPSNRTYDGLAYNKTNGFSTWQVRSYVKKTGKICLDKSRPQKKSISGEVDRISAGDKISFPKMCGTEGAGIGGSVNRRSDCDKSINYFRNTGKKNDVFPYRGRLSRRFYMYIPSETELPAITFKLTYSHFRKGPDNKRYSNVLTITVQRSERIYLKGPGGGAFTSKSVERDTWYYFEEVFERESVKGAADGSYKMYWGKAGQTDGIPAVEQDNIEVGEFIDLSINGNWQHSNEVSGYVYFDDVRITNFYQGDTAR
tara:strand:+ start:36352 stop:37530 length:1179 start_codon:yes stop_codon:yes gene_type:complete